MTEDVGDPLSAETFLAEMFRVKFALGIFFEGGLSHEDS